MIFGKSITIDEQHLEAASTVADVTSAFERAEIEFIESLRAGSCDAFDTLINRYSADVYALLLRLTEDHEEAGDLTQETFLSALRSIKSFRGESELKTWLYRIAVNQSRNRFRWWKRRKKSSTVSLDDSVGRTEMVYADTIADECDSPEEAAQRAERERALRSALIEIAEPFREVIVLCDIEGMKYGEIAAALDINVGTVKSRLARGREELRLRLKDF